MGSEIILLGAGPSAAECPYDKEVWGVNTTIRWNRRQINKLFFFDDLETFDPMVMSLDDLKYNHRNTEYISTFKNVKYAAKAGIEIIEYPLDAIIRKYNTTYFCNSVAYMIAYAMFTDVKSMDLYGIDHLTGQSYLTERAGAEYWLGRAAQSGMEINVSLGSAILHTMNGKMYGYDCFYDGKNPTYNELVMM
jgi:hypothetical protein